MSLALVIITRDEEEHLERCIRSVPFADEIVVVDSGSRDSTVELAGKLGAEVFHRDFKDFSSQKQWAIEKARSDWILSLDADEYLSEGMAMEMEALLNGDQRCNGYMLPFRVLYMNRLMRFGPWRGEKHLRLFRRGMAQFPSRAVHEGLVLNSGSPGIVEKGYVIHQSFSNLDEQLLKMMHYARTWAAEQHDLQRRSGFLRIALRTAWRFLSGYLLRGGFLEGVPGLAAATVSSFYVFLKWAYLRELNREDANS